MPDEAASPVADGSLLCGEGLHLGYGKQVVVRDVSVELRPGCVTALVGPNGSGKSTLLRSLARLHPLTGGEVALGPVDGHPRRAVSLLSPREFAREVTLFSQSRPTPQGLTVGDVVAFGRHPYRRRFAGLSAQDRAAIARAMAMTGVADMADRAVSQLSGGEAQRAWLAACLAQDTTVVLLDEPTNHLDLRYQVETLDLVRDLSHGHGVAVGIVLHDLDHAARVADDLLLMSAGQIHDQGHPFDVLTADAIGDVYGLKVEVSIDPRNGCLRIDPLSRYPVRVGG